VFAMSAARYRSLPDDPKLGIDANSGPETSAWLARVIWGFETTTLGERRDNELETTMRQPGFKSEASGQHGDD